LDEPTSHLDLPSSVEFLQLLKKLATEKGKTIIFSSHNLALVFKMVDKILLLDYSSSYALGTPREISEHELMCSFLKTDAIRFENGDLIFKITENEN
jgi:iron complex transport system ATP-binding protein